MIHGAAGLLLSAAVGYLVIERADKHKEGSVRRVGFIIGTFIAVASILGIACVVSCNNSGSGWCSMKVKKSGAYCPITGKAM